MDNNNTTRTDEDIHIEAYRERLAIIWNIGVLNGIVIDAAIVRAVIEARAEYNHSRAHPNIRGLVLERAIERFRSEDPFPRRHFGLGVLAHLNLEYVSHRFRNGQFPGTNRPHPFYTASREVLRRLRVLTRQYLARDPEPEASQPAAKRQRRNGP